MTADLTRERAREQVARAIHAEACCPDWPSPWCDGPTNYSDIDAALTVLWPEIERLRRERDQAREGKADAERYANDSLATLDEARTIHAETAQRYFARLAELRADLAHAHTVIARHVEPLRKPCRPEAGDCCDGSAHTWQPAQGSRLPDCGPAAAPVGDQGSGRVETRGKEDHG